MAQELPKFVSIKSIYPREKQEYYAAYPKEPETHVCCLEPTVYSPSVKIEVERSKTNPNYVHLRFCYSNRYWQKNGLYIVTSTKKPVEDTSEPTCTLFEPFKRDDGYYTFRHVQSGGSVLQAGDRVGTLGVRGTADDSVWYLFTVVDWDALVILPKYLAFKGDNGKYLKSQWIQGKPYLQFSSDDPNEYQTAYQVTMLPHGHFVIRSVYFNKYWSRNSDWILVNSVDNSGQNSETLFWPVIASAGGNTIALRNEGNQKFCQRFTAESKDNCLNASSPAISSAAKLEVVELVFNRQIYNIVYLMDDARIVDESPFIAGKGIGVNHNGKETKLTIKVAYEEEKSYSFSNTTSVSLGVSTKISTGFPYILNGEIEVSGELSTEFEWGTTTTMKTVSEASYEVLIPAYSQMTVNYVGTKGTCNIPFTYTQKDRSSIDGKLITSTNLDGIYVGVNSYNYRFENAKVIPLAQVTARSAL